MQFQKNENQIKEEIKKDLEKVELPKNFFELDLNIQNDHLKKFMENFQQIVSKNKFTKDVVIKIIILFKPLLNSYY